MLMHHGLRNSLSALLLVITFAFSSPVQAKTTSHSLENYPTHVTTYDDEAKSAVAAVLMSVTLAGAGFGFLSWATKLDHKIGEVFAPVGFALSLIGPSAGQMYAGRHGRAWTHIGMRGATLGITLVFAAAYATSVAGGIFNPLKDDPNSGNYLIGMHAGIAAYTGLMVWGFVDGAIQTNRYNESLEETWSVQPTAMNAIDKKSQRRVAPGLALRTSF